MTLTRFGIEFNLQEDKIYLDSATIGKMPISSLNMMCEFYQEIGGVPVRSMSQDAINCTNILEDNRKMFADILNIENNQVSFLPSKESTLINALYSLDVIKKSKIITSFLEDHSILAPVIRVHESFNADIDYITIEEEANLISTLETKLGDDKQDKIVLLSSLTVTNGVKRDWKQIAKLCKETEAIFILDVSHSVGHENVDLKSIAPDIVFGSGCIGALGPQGIAFQILSHEIENRMEPLIVGNGSVLALEEHMFHLGGSGSKFEAGIVNIAGIIAMVNSLKMLSDIGFTKIEEHERKLNNILRDELRNIQNIKLMEIENVSYGPIISFGSDSFESHDIAMVLEETRKIVVRSGALCSHLFMYEQKYNDLVRTSTHIYNTEEEIKTFIETLASLLSGM